MFKQKKKPESDYCIIRQESPYSVVCERELYRGPLEGVPSALLELGDALYYGPLYSSKYAHCQRDGDSLTCIEKASYTIEFVRVRVL